MFRAKITVKGKVYFMATTEQHDGVTYQLRRLTDRWVHPMGGEVISTHPSQGAALAAYDREPQSGGDGSGRSTFGSFVPSVVIRVDADGTESVAMMRRTGGAPWTYPRSAAPTNGRAPA